ncbi:PEP-CTERM sorting domain-containing protein [Aquabacterium humicola]|uniref:PEP-CTERM sorting domain-containing protein n=1 Tax=Aquabacterium humicola TaxID=3237377 RepID=UPI0025430EB5|nr:PEP-CTERM sorting domain-containing protein [Rubrivivax pictus]
MGLEALKRSAIGAALAAAALAATPAQAGIVVVDVSLIFSNDALGSATNEVLSVAIGAWQNVVKVSWDVELYADSPSWLSEISVDISGVNGNGIALSPGVGANVSGAQVFAGSFDLLANALNFQADATGNLRLEFFESFDDFTNAPPDNWDGIWRSGSITIETIPEPATYGLMGVALLGAAFASRRRQRADAATA